MSLVGLITGIVSSFALIFFDAWKYYSVVPFSVASGTFFYLKFCEIKHEARNKVSILKTFLKISKQSVFNCLALLSGAMLCVLQSKQFISFWGFSFLYFSLVFFYYYFSSLIALVPIIKSIRLILSKEDEYI